MKIVGGTLRVCVRYVNGEIAASCSAKVTRGAWDQANTQTSTHYCIIIISSVIVMGYLYT